LTEDTDIFGEIAAVENEIIRIAWEAVARRREEAKKRGNQLRLNGTVQESGFAIYADFNDYMEVRKRQKELKLGTWGLRRIWQEIRDTLLSKGWTASPHHPETRFYPP